MTTKEKPKDITIRGGVHYTVDNPPKDNQTKTKPPPPTKPDPEKSAAPPVPTESETETAPPE